MIIKKKKNRLYFWFKWKSRVSKYKTWSSWLKIIQKESSSLDINHKMENENIQKNNSSENYLKIENWGYRRKEDFSKKVKKITKLKKLLQ